MEWSNIFFELKNVTFSKTYFFINPPYVTGRKMGQKGQHGETTSMIMVKSLEEKSEIIQNRHFKK